MLPTTQLTVNVQRITGQTLPGAKIVLELTREDVDPDHGAVVLGIINATADAQGLATIDAWPNARGTRGSQYKARILDNGRTVWSALLSVPESVDAIDLTSAISQAPFPSKSDAQIAQEAAQQSAADAAASATAAEADAIAAAGSAAAAASSETNAVAAADAAQTASAAAEAARDAAQAAQAAAETASTDSQAARDAAQTAQAAAETASTAAQTARDAAQAAQAAAESARDAAVIARDEAEAFAAESAGNAVAVVGVLQHALDQAGQAVRELEAMGLRVTDVTETTLPVVGNLQYAIDIAAQAARSVSGGRAQFVGGFADSPAITIGDVAIYSSAADTLSVAIAGTEVLRVDAAGITVFGTVTEAP